MSELQSLCRLLGINEKEFSKKEFLFLEADLFARIFEELKEIIREQNKEYFRLMKLNTEKENTMIETNFIRCIIEDILLTEEYTLAGIAYYTNTPEDVIYEIVSGCNNYPTLLFSQKIIALHRSVRPNLYHQIVNKIKEPLVAA